MESLKKATIRCLVSGPANSPNLAPECPAEHPNNRSLTATKVSAPPNPIPEGIDWTHPGRRAGGTSPHLRKPRRQAKEQGASVAAGAVRDVKSGGATKEGADTVGEGLDHARASSAEVAEDLLGGAGGVVRAGAGVHLGFRQGGERRRRRGGAGGGCEGEVGEEDRVADSEEG
jgi:hypothetical protein